MNYKMKVTIAPTETSHNPEAKERLLTLDAVFAVNPDTYGNKHYLSIRDGHGFDLCYDIRYDTSFNPKRKVEYLKRWARSYWCGKNGAWKINSLEVERVGE